MKINTNKKNNFYTQSQQFAARILLIVTLFFSYYRPETVLAVHKEKEVSRGEASRIELLELSLPDDPSPLERKVFKGEASQVELIEFKIDNLMKLAATYLEEKNRKECFSCCRKASEAYGELEAYGEADQEDLNHPFIEACIKGDNEATAKIPISLLGNKDLYDTEDNPLICWMAQHEMAVTLERVLALVWNPNLPNTSQIYPLHYGAMKSAEVTKLLLEAKAHPFVQTAKGNTPAMVALNKDKMKALELLLPKRAELSFESLAIFEASYETYKKSFTPSAAGNEEPLVALELALQLGDAELLQAIGIDKATSLLSQLIQMYPIGEDAIQVRFQALLPSPSPNS